VIFVAQVRIALAGKGHDSGGIRIVGTHADHDRVGAGQDAYHRAPRRSHPLHRFDLRERRDRVGAGPHGFVKATVEVHHAAHRPHAQRRDVGGGELCAERRGATHPRRDRQERDGRR
jgi:hypothetical protein